MVDDRYSRGTGPQGDYYNRSETQDYGQDYGAGREGRFSSARSYEAAGEDVRRRGYGQRGDDRGRYGQDRYEERGGQSYAGSYGSDGRRFESYGDVDRSRDRTGSDEDRFGRGNERDRGYGRQPQGYDYDERGFAARAGDEVRSWFGDEDADRRRQEDARRDGRESARQGRDYGEAHDDYHAWRRTQIDALDRDYDEYRQHNRTRFNSEFGSWRTQRQGQRDQLGRVREHQEVVGSDGGHVGVVDHVRGDNLLLTKNDQDAGGRHHTIPSAWITGVDDKVTIAKTADEAKREWRDAENSQAMFGGDRKASDDQGGRTSLNRAFSGTN